MGRETSLCRNERKSLFCLNCLCLYRTPPLTSHPFFLSAYISHIQVYEKLEKVVQYLRQEHSYCFWCSAQYYGQKDLEENCPGEFEDDH